MEAALEPVTPEVMPPEKTALLQVIAKLDRKQVTDVLEIFAMLVRAFEGKEVNPDSDVITRLINVKNILERSNFPSMPIINFQVYARLLNKYHPELEAFKDWADYQAEALKSYKALSSEQYVDMMKAQLGAPQTAPGTSINLNPQLAQQTQKRGLFRRQERQPRYSEEDKE